MAEVSFNEAVSFSRASTATYFDANGVLRTAAADEPRFTHDPETGKPQGLLIEESRTNLLMWSEDLTNAAWDKFAAFSWEYSVGAKPSPISGVNFSRFYVPQDVTSTTSLYYQSGNTVVDSRYVFSFIVSKDYNLLRYCQVDGLSSTRSIFDIDTGAFVYIHPNHTVGANDLGDSWLVWVSFEATADSARVGVMPQETSSAGYNKDFTAGGYQYTTGFQLESASTPSSYIPTQDAPVTRAADNVSRVLGEEFNPSSGTVFVEYMLPAHDRTSFSCVIGYSGSNYIGLGYNTSAGQASSTFFVVDDDGYNLVHQHLNVAYGQRVKYAISFRAGSSYSVVVNGISDKGPVLPNDLSSIAKQLWLAQRRGQFRYSGTVADVRYIPRALSEQELIELTS